MTICWQRSSDSQFRGSSVDEVIATALRDAVKKSEPSKGSAELPVLDKGHLQPDVDLNNNAAVRCLLGGYVARFSNE